MAQSTVKKLIQWYGQFSSEWKNRNRFNLLPQDWREIVFYAESGSDWPHFEGIVAELLKSGKKITYLTSDHRDPTLRFRGIDARYQNQFLPLVIGDGTVRTLLFKELKCSVCVISLPDLEKYQLKRSIHPVHYVYVFHSINSVHRVYREGAFDAYDTIFCVGPHHLTEIRKTEEVYGLKPKHLVEQGHTRVDTILERHQKLRESYQPSPQGPKKIVLGPSWGDCSFIERPWGYELIEELLKHHHQISLRLHPMTVRHYPKLAQEYTDRFPNSGLKVITDMAEQESLAQADLMISDWSGAAFDFAFGLERPVLFVNTPSKINNPAWTRIGQEPLESSIRTQIGDVLDMSDLPSLQEKIEKLCANRDAKAGALRAARSQWVYQIGKSGKVGAESILELLKKTGGGTQ